MQTQQVKTIEDMVPHIQQHLVPTTLEAVNVCIDCYNADQYNDYYTFATQIWKNWWNRCYEIAASGTTPFRLKGKGNEYKLKCGDVVFRLHRIDEEADVPRGAKAAKASADLIFEQMVLPGMDLENDCTDDDPCNIILALDASPKSGVREIFIGELERYSEFDKKYHWAKKALVYSSLKSEMITPETAAVVYVEEPEALVEVSYMHTDEEQVPEEYVNLEKEQGQSKSPSEE